MDKAEGRLCWWRTLTMITVSFVPGPLASASASYHCTYTEASCHIDDNISWREQLMLCHRIKTQQLVQFLSWPHYALVNRVQIFCSDCLCPLLLIELTASFPERLLTSWHRFKIGYIAFFHLSAYTSKYCWHSWQQLNHWQIVLHSNWTPAFFIQTMMK